MRDCMKCVTKASKSTVWVDTDHPSYPRDKRPPGPGTVLKAMLRKLKVHPEPGCGCRDYARKMNEWGPEGCRRELSEIVARLTKEAVKRKIPVPEYLVRSLVLRAIKVSESRGASVLGGHK